MNLKRMGVGLAASLFFVSSLVFGEPAGGNPKEIAATITCPGKVFRDEALSGHVEVVNKGKTACPGAIYLKYTGQKIFMTIIDEDWNGKPGEKKVIPFTVLPFSYEGLEGGKTIQIIHRDDKSQDTVLAGGSFDVLFHRLPRTGENILPNASFELAGGFCGTSFGPFDYEMHIFQWQGNVWTGLEIDGWWAIGNSREGIEVIPGGRTGFKCLKIAVGKDARSVTASAGYYVSKGQYTLSAYVKTQGVEGTFWLGYYKGLAEAKRSHAEVGKGIPLPANANDWTRVSVTVECPDTLMVMPQVSVGKGTLLMDDIQVERGVVATAFNVSPREMLRLSFDGVEDTVMPKWIASDSAKRRIRVYNDSRLPLSGKVSVRLGPWNLPEGTTIAEFDAAQVPPGKVKEVKFSTLGLRPDGYVVSIRLKDGLVVHDGIWDFDPNAYTAWSIRPMLHSRAVGRIALVPLLDPKKLFGIGNTEIRMTGFWQNRSYLQYHADLRDLGWSCTRGIGADDNETFMNAVAGGVGIYAHQGYDEAPGNCDFANPCAPNKVDVCHPKGIQRLKDYAQQVAKELAANPLIVGVQLANEQYWAANGIPCPTKPADDSFREWCKKEHGDLKTLNERWGTNYTAWDQVDQVISEKFYTELAEKKKKEKAPLSFGGGVRWDSSWPKAALDEMDRLPGKTMDWLRWRTWTGVESYRIFKDAAHQFDKKTLYTTDLPIPTFRKQFFIPFTRAMDAVHINSRYTSGYDMSFGTPHEHMCDQEMAESLARAEGKPFWGIEIYQKPFWPAESAALQNWGLIAHGMNVAMIFSWGPFSDTGVPDKILAWKERKNRKSENIFDKVCWYMIDVDNSRMPAFDPYVRSVREIRQYHERFDGMTVRRVNTDIAYYISNDTCEYDLLLTKCTPWAAVADRVCYTLIYLLRLNGITADFVDDATLPDAPGQFRTIVVPLASVLRQPVAEKIARFARKGGTVILAGTCGRMDPWLRKYSNFGGPAWTELNWQGSQYKEDFGQYVFDEKLTLPTQPGLSATETTGQKNEKRDETLNENKVFRGVELGTMAGAEPILDAKKKTVGWKRSWGEGKLIAYGICPDTWTTDPHLTPNLAVWTRQMIDLAGLKSSGRWMTVRSDNPMGTQLGTGAPAVDLVVREKSPGEKFIFCLNQGGKGEGLVEIPVIPGTWLAEDLIRPDNVIEGTIEKNIWQAKLAVDPLGYRILRIINTDK